MISKVFMFSTNTREHHNFITITPHVLGLVLSRVRLIDEKEEQVELEYSRTLESPITVRYNLSVAPLIELTVLIDETMSNLPSSELFSVKTGFHTFKTEGNMTYSGQVELNGKRRFKISSRIEDQGDTCVFADLSLRVVSVSGLGNIESSAFERISLSNDLRIIDKISSGQDLKYRADSSSVDIFSSGGTVKGDQFQVDGNKVSIDLDANDEVYVSYIPEYVSKAENIQINEDMTLLPDGTIEITNHAHLNGKVYFDLKISLINPPNILKNESPVIKNISVITY